MTPEEFRDLRDKAIPLPPRDPNGYRHVLLLGATGAGKTTLLRQLIGTSPEERFPSTSASKTTIADTEIILDEGPWRAVVTFASSNEVREHLNECISEHCCPTFFMRTGVGVGLLGGFWEAGRGC